MAPPSSGGLLDESCESTTPSTESSCDKSSKANDFSSDEAKESEGDLDPVDPKSNPGKDSSGISDESNVPRIEPKIQVKHSCDICNITVNSSTQLAQVIINLPF